MLGPSDSFIAVEYCGDGIEMESGDEIAIVVFGVFPHAQPRLHKLVGWLKVAARLPVEELEFLSSALNEIVNRIRLSQGNLFGLKQFENSLRIRGPFSADHFDTSYKSKILR